VQDLETEVFLHLLQRNAADAGDSRAAASAAVAHSSDAGPRRCAPPVAPAQSWAAPGAGLSPAYRACALAQPQCAGAVAPRELRRAVTAPRVPGTPLPPGLLRRTEAVARRGA